MELVMPISAKENLKKNMKAFSEKLKRFPGQLWQTVWRVGRDDPRRVVHALKVGLSLTLVSLLYLLEPLFKGIGQNAIWAVMTVVVVLEFTAGATLCKGLNRGLGTLLAGSLAFLTGYIAEKTGLVFRAVFIGAAVFVIGTATTYMSPANILSLSVSSVSIPLLLLSSPLPPSKTKDLPLLAASSLCFDKKKMELVKELFVTGVIAVLFSFLIAKLVAMAMSSGDSSHHEDSQTQNVDREAFSAAEIVGEEEEKGMMEELRYRERLEVEGLKSEMRTEFVEQVTEKVYEFVTGISSVEHAKDSATRDEILLESETDVQELIEAVLKEEEEEDKLKEGEFYDEDVKQVNLVSSNRENREEEPIGVELNVVEEIGVAGSDSKERIEEIEVNEVEDDGDWEGIERSELEKIFGEAAKFVEESGNKDERLASAGSDLQMELYGLHKIATEGPCREQPPMALKVSARAKWNAWQRLGNMSPEAAMEQYIALVLERAPGWMEEKPSGDNKPGSSEVENLVAVTPDLSTLSSRQPNFTDEMTCRNPEPKPVAEEGDPTGGSNLDSRPKNDKHCPAA